MVAIRLRALAAAVLVPLRVLCLFSLRRGCSRLSVVRVFLRTYTRGVRLLLTKFISLALIE